MATEAAAGANSAASAKKKKASAHGVLLTICSAVKHLVQAAFEILLVIYGITSDEDSAGEDSIMKDEGDLGLQPASRTTSYAADSAGENSMKDGGLQPMPADFLNAGPNRLYSSLDDNTDRLGLDSRTSAGGCRSRRTSLKALRSSWNKNLKVTSPHPFKLRTEQRGRFKEQQLAQKVREMLLEQEKKRIPIAQGLPWTTYEPECIIKPAVKEGTEPLDLVLHSDVHALERAEFDQRWNEFGKQQRLKWQRQDELEEQERIRQLRTELIPKAQPMTYFDRSFILKRSTKPATIPMELKFHLGPEKLSCMLTMLGYANGQW
nr:unnamed protein product [Digitaria exilis]